MKRILPILFALLVVLPAAAQVRETPAVIGLVQGGSPQGFIQGTNDQAILWSTQSGARGNPIPYTDIKGEGLDKAIRYDERDEMLADARALFRDGDYSAAAAAFGKVAQDYQIIINGPQNFASEALFYQAESLLRAGQYAALAEVVNAPAARTIETKLDDRYKRNFEFHKLWALLGQNKFDDLAAALEIYQEPVTGDAKLLPSPNFKDLPPTELAQLSYLRGKVFEAKGEKEKALDDFYRTFLLSYGNETLLAKLAMGASMQIHKADPLLERENAQAIAHMQSVAYFFSKRFGKDTMPADYQAFAVRPVMTTLVNEAPAEEEAEAAEGESAPAPAEGEKPEEAAPDAAPEGEAKSE